MAYSKARRLAEIVADTNGNISVEGLVVPTQSASDNDTSAASTAYVTTAVSGLIDSAPSTLNTLNEIAAALNDDANFNTTVTNSIAAKLPLAGGTLTGNLTVNTSSYPKILLNDQTGVDRQFTIGVSNETFIIRNDTGTADILSITNANNVGIGTTTPSQKLHVVGGQARFDDHISIQPTKKLFLDGGNDTYIDEVAANTIAFHNGGAERMRIDSNGRVGIKQSPGASNFTLQVTGMQTDGTDGRAVRITGYGTQTSIGSTGPTISIQNANNTANNYVKLGFESSGGGETVSINAQTIDHSNHYGDIAFNTRGSGGYSEKMRIRSNGNVGIGTTSANANLHVGSSNATGSSANPAIQVGGASTYRLGLYTDSEGGIIQNLNGDNGLQFRVKTAGEVMRIMPSGRVGIGQTSPSHALHVVGGDNDEARVRVHNSASGQASLDLDNSEGYFRIFTDAGTLRVYDQTDGEYRMYIDTSGNLGVGTASPANTFHVNAGSANNVARFESTDTEARILLKDSSGTAYIAARNDIRFGNDTTTERMRLDSNGYLRLLETSKTHHSAYLGLILPNGGIISEDTGAASRSMNFVHNAYVDSGNEWTYMHADEASLIQHYNGATTFSNAGAGTADTTITWNERMRISASGCVGVGSTADRSLGTNIGTLVVNGSAGGGLWLSTGDSSATTSKIYSITDGSVGELIINQGGSNGGTIKFTHNQSSTPTMALLSNGVVLFKTATQGGISNGTSNINCGSLGNGQLVLATNNDIPIIINRALGSGTMLAIRNNGSNVGSITQNGSSTSFNTSSDYRLKENVDYTWDATTRLKQLKPARFNFIADETNTLIDGFLAHEVSSIVPEAVHGEKDGEEMQAIDYSKLVPLLVKTIQELEARLATLEG